MATTTARKFKIKEGWTLLAVNAPDKLGQLLDPSGSIKIITKGDNYQQIHWFVRNRSEMEHDLDRVLKLLGAGVVCWVYYPKGTSKIQTDLTRDKGWDRLRARQGLQWLGLVSLDDTWSAFAFRINEEGQKPASVKPVANPAQEYIDPLTRQVRLPEDVARELKKHKKEAAFFDSLAYSHKKEYVQWILDAKKEETRAKRISSMIERLGKQWKNPSNN